MCIGNMMDAQAAERAGLVSRVVPVDKVGCSMIDNLYSLTSITYVIVCIQLQETALATAEKIASFSLPAVMMCKETVNAAYEMTLEEGLRFERRIFHSMFSLDDQKEGMSAFAEKRKPQWKHH
jgi:enoyl-CoA hydratase